jgi:hypothetical protein
MYLLSMIMLDDNVSQATMLLQGLQVLAPLLQVCQVSCTGPTALCGSGRLVRVCAKWRLDLQADV